MRTAAGVLALSLVLSGCSSVGTTPTNEDLSTPAVATDGDAAADDGPRSREEQMAGAAEALRLDPSLLPEVELVRYVTPDEEMDVHKLCMAEQGWMGTEGQGLSFDVPAGQEQAYGLAAYACAGRYPLHPVYTAAPDEAGLKVLYDHRVGTLTPCLQALGYDVPAAPSWETFLADKGGWDPVGATMDQIVADPRWSSADELEEACPSMPPWDEVYRPEG